MCDIIGCERFSLEEIKSVDILSVEEPTVELLQLFIFLN